MPDPLGDPPADPAGTQATDATREAVAAHVAPHVPAHVAEHVAERVAAAHAASLHREHRRRVARELVANALYLDMVFLAGLVVFPADELPTGLEAVAIILGAAAGLLAAHWLSFRLAVQVTTEGNWHEAASQEVAAQLVGGLGVAVLTALPFVLLDGLAAMRASLIVLTIPPAVAGVAIGRMRRRSWPVSIAVGLATLLAVGVVVAIKIGGHH